MHESIRELLVKVVEFAWLYLHMRENFLVMRKTNDEAIHSSVVSGLRIQTIENK